MLQHTDRLVAKIPAMDVDLRNDTLKETRRAALLVLLLFLLLSSLHGKAGSAGNETQKLGCTNRSR